jgi:hypothetical protein
MSAPPGMGEARSYIDYDEIVGLIEGLDYIAKADANMTKLKSFEVSYSTKGDLKSSCSIRLPAERASRFKPAQSLDRRS